MPDTITIETIGDRIDHGNSLWVYCTRPRCDHGSEVDLEALARRMGRDHSCMRDALIGKFYCSKCGSREVMFITSPETPAPVAKVDDELAARKERPVTRHHRRSRRRWKPLA